MAELASAQPSRQRVDQLVDLLLGTSEPFDERLIGGGPWQVGGRIALAAVHVPAQSHARLDIAVAAPFSCTPSTPPPWCGAG